MEREKEKVYLDLSQCTFIMFGNSVQVSKNFIILKVRKRKRIVRKVFSNQSARGTHFLPTFVMPRFEGDVLEVCVVELVRPPDLRWQH